MAHAREAVMSVHTGAIVMARIWLALVLFLLTVFSHPASFTLTMVPLNKTMARHYFIVIITEATSIFLRLFIGLYCCLHIVVPIMHIKGFAEVHFERKVLKHVSTTKKSKGKSH